MMHGHGEGAVLSTTMDPTYVVASVIISALGAYISMQIAGTVIALRVARRSRWRYAILSLSAFFAATISIFCLHFVGLLGIQFHPARDHVYDVALTVLSFIASVVFASTAIFLVLYFRLREVEKNERDVKRDRLHEFYTEDGGIRLVKREDANLSPSSVPTSANRSGSVSIIGSPRSHRSRMYSPRIAPEPEESLEAQQADCISLGRQSSQSSLLPNVRDSRIPTTSTTEYCSTDSMSLCNDPSQQATETLACVAQLDLSAGMQLVDTESSTTPVVTNGPASADSNSSLLDGTYDTVDAPFAVDGAASSNLASNQTQSPSIAGKFSALYERHVKLSLWLLLLCVALFALGALMMHHLGMLALRSVCVEHLAAESIPGLIVGVLASVACVLAFHLCPTGAWSLLGALIVGSAVAAFHYVSNMGMQFLDTTCPILGNDDLPLIHANDLGVFIITFALIASIIMEVFVSQMLARDQRRVRTLMSENREQRKLAEALLCSIVPDLVARELRQGIRYTGEHQATVIFIDICGFTSRSASASPAELVASLDEFYMHVDSAAARLGIERIKFLGDGLMLACGAPHPVDQHQAVAIEFAFEVLRFVPHLKFCGSAFDIRIGAASGTVISGVVGFRRFAYDIWSPVVNLASRLESTGEPGALQISEATFAAVSSDHPLAAFFEQRQDVSAKGIGIITTYILRYRKHADALLRVRPTVLENRQKRMQAAVASLTAASVSQISPLSTSFDHYRVVRSQGTARFVAESGDDET